MLWKSGLMRSISGRICWRFTTLHRGCTTPGHSAAHPQPFALHAMASAGRRVGFISNIGQVFHRYGKRVGKSVEGKPARRMPCPKGHRSCIRRGSSGRVGPLLRGIGRPTLATVRRRSNQEKP